LLISWEPSYHLPTRFEEIAMPHPRTLSDLMQSLRAFQESRLLLSAIELDVLVHCADTEASAVAAAVGTDPRATAMLLDALTAVGVLVKEQGRYRCTEAALALGKERAGVMHTVHLWDTWSSLSDCVRTGRSQRTGPKGAHTEAFIEAMRARAVTVATHAQKVIGTEGVKRVLDVGGGPATFAIAFARAAPELTAEVLDLPAVVPIAQKHIREAGLEGRVTARAGDLRKDELGQGFDLILVSAICHMLSEEENQELLSRCARALAPGGRVAIREFILNPDRAGPPAAAMFALNMLVGTEKGNSYTEAEYRAWLTGAGLGRVSRPEPQGDWIIGQPI